MISAPATSSAQSLPDPGEDPVDPRTADAVVVDPDLAVERLRWPPPRTDSATPATAGVGEDHHVDRLAGRERLG
jgi:hypothetical protein